MFTKGVLISVRCEALESDQTRRTVRTSRVAEVSKYGAEVLTRQYPNHSTRSLLRNDDSYLISVSVSDGLWFTHKDLLRVVISIRSRGGVVPLCEQVNL